MEVGACGFVEFAHSTISSYFLFLEQQKRNGKEAPLSRLITLFEPISQTGFAYELLSDRLIRRRRLIDSLRDVKER